MDTSKQYIEMCKKAFEIYDGRYFIEGDFLLTKPTEQQESYVTIFAEHDCCGGDLCDGREFNFFVSEDVECWLPRQDQLQEIVDMDYVGSHIEDIKHFYTFSDVGTESTWEQLWLAFVMKKKYNKEWKGNDWETIK